MAEIKVRVRTALKEQLRQKAHEKGVSMNEYIRLVLEEHLMAPEIRAIENKYDALLREITAAYRDLAADLEGTVSANSEVMARLLDYIDAHEAQGGDAS